MAQQAGAEHSCNFAQRHPDAGRGRTFSMNAIILTRTGVCLYLATAAMCLTALIVSASIFYVFAVLTSIAAVKYFILTKARRCSGDCFPSVAKSLMPTLMRRSFVVLYIASAFAFAPRAPASTLGDEIFASGFQYQDFPAAPIMDPSAPANAATLFGATGTSSGGPCMADPETGTLFPQNWLRPRFTWVATGSENLFELRIAALNQDDALVVYTTATTWTMPADVWAGLSQHTVDQPITVEVRGATYASGSGNLTSGPALGSSGTIRVAPVSAPGAIVYWTLPSSGMLLRGFRIGDEDLKNIVSPAGAGTACVGCHTATPDGVDVGFSASGGSAAGLGLLSSDGQQLTPSFVTASARTLMAREDQEAPAFSKLHWTTGDRVAVTMYQSQIMWTDLEATSTAQGAGWNFLARTGETASAASASFAHNSDTVLYVASTSEVTQGVTVTSGDLETVPFNNRAGGTPTPVAGAATATYNEYYPSFSPDDKYIAYNRVPTGMSSYNNGQAEVYVIPSAGGTPVRIAANDPSACTGQTSPGVTNSWPRWSPEAQDNGGRRFYWMTFSSTRSGTERQIYIAPVVDDGTTLTTYPALYPWNQDASEDDHTPAWDNFSIPF
jgi:hypothetical protein